MLDWIDEWEPSYGLYFASLPYSDSLDAFGDQFVYAITTSGTSGEPKNVLVPATAIMPNVQDFMYAYFLLVMAFVIIRMF